MQVVTSENFQQLIETGKVPEFKAPEAGDVKPTETPADGAQPRGEDGKFVKADGTIDKSQEKTDKADTGATPENDDEDDADLPEKVRRQIGKKHRAMKEAEEFAEQQYNERKAAERRAEKLSEELETLKTKSRPDQKTEAKAPPKPEDFNTVAEYADALTDYKVELKLAERDREAQEQRQKDEAARLRADLNARIVKAAKEIPDYEDVVSRSNIDVPAHMAQYIAESEIGPHIGYHFAKNQEDFNRIAKLSPIRAIAELGKLEAKLETKSAPPPPVATEKTPVQPVSKAPAPIEPLDGKAAPVQKDPAKMTFQELREYERQKAASRRR